LQSAAELERLGDALEELAGLEPALAELVDMHFFCGYSFREVASLRGVSERTVQRDWRKARMLLQQALLEDDEVRDVESEHRQRRDRPRDGRV
jgi:RNA polymerase sigma factor (sigma-70 family)